MKTHIVFALFWLLNVNSSFAWQNQTPFDTGEIPFEMVKKTIVIPVQIKGTTYKFILDTGGVLMLSKELQQAHQFQVYDEITVLDINKNKRNFQRVTIDKISIGNATFTEQQAIVSFDNKTYPGKCFGTDGMIGRNFFKGKLLQIDYKRKVLRLTEDETLFKLNKKYHAPLKISNRGLPEVLMQIDGKKQYIEFDSGSGDFFSYKTKDAKRLSGKSGNEKLQFKGIFSFGVSKQNVKSTTRYRIKIDSLQLGKTWFANFYSDFSKPSAPRIGAGILYKGKLTIDYKNLGFYFEPYDVKSNQKSCNTFGFSIASVNNDYIIKWVLKGSPAEKAGLLYGMKIISINNQPVSKIPDDCNFYINGYPFETAEEVKLSYKDQKNRLKSITLRKLYF